MWIDIDQLSKQQLRKIEYILKEQKMPKIKVKVEYPECMPERTHRWDAGWDLKCKYPVSIPAGETLMVKTGTIFEIPPRHYGLVCVRSSVGKLGVVMTNGVGIIDSEYRGEVMVNLVNNGTETFKLEQFDRFAQILINPVNVAELWQVDAVSKTDRGDGGFGSTTVKKVFDTPGDVGIPSETSTAVEPSAVDKRNASIQALMEVKPSDYLKMKKDGSLFEKFPIATGEIKDDLGL